VTSILFLAKANHDGAAEAAEYLRRKFNVVARFGGWGDRLDAEALTWRGDYIVSYLAPWVVSAGLLKAAGKAAINFHPGPPSYPGIGCTNFALYDGVDRFGVTCHHMALPVDSGAVIRVRRFDVAPDETVFSLTEKCHAAIAELFFEVMAFLEADAPLPMSTESWTRRAYRRYELNALCQVTPDMDPAEIRRRVHATSYPGAPGAYVQLAGIRFEYHGDPLLPVPVETK
jgi:methionyl-tRNA formyltransferase